MQDRKNTSANEVQNKKTQLPNETDSLAIKI